MIITAGLPESNTDEMRWNAFSMVERRCWERVFLVLFLRELFLIILYEALTLIDVSPTYFALNLAYAAKRSAIVTPSGIYYVKVQHLSHSLAFIILCHHKNTLSNFQRFVTLSGIFIPGYTHLYYTPAFIIICNTIRLLDINNLIG